ncbi:MAG: ISKra4 family transposase [Pseudomonadota bacterium]|nr:ISKra4 family transposase [Pseudomonadota bacterium]
MTMVHQGPAQSKPDSVEELISQMRGFVQRAAAQGQGAHEVERGLFKWLLQLGLLLLKEYFFHLGTGDEGEQVEVAGIGRLKRSPTLQGRRYQSLFGEVVVQRWVYARGQKRKVEYVAVDARARLPAGKFSYLLQDWAQHLAVDCAFGQVKTFFRRLLGLELPVASLEQMNRALSEEVEGFWQEQPPAPVAGEARVVVLSADAKGVPMRKAPEAPAAPALTPPSGPKPGRKKMALVGAAYTVAPHVRTPRAVVDALFAPGPSLESADAPRRAVPEHKRVRAVLSEAEVGQAGHSAQVIFPWLGQQAQQRDPSQGHPWVVVMDGQPTLWDELDAALGARPRVEILDLLHAAGYLWQAVHLFHDPGTEQAEKLMQVCLLGTLEGQVQTVIEWLTDEAKNASLPAKAHASLSKIAAYFQRHRHRVHYDRYLAAGYPIASGVIEGACRHVVNDRLERTGMNWTLPGAQAMLALRCVAINDQWEEFMTYRIAQETARLYPYAANSSPESEPEPFLRAA